MKKCKYCKKEKNISAFGVYRNSLDGLNINCKECECKRQAKYKANKKPPLFSEYKEFIGFF